jgi:hypothetical protein
LEQPATPQILFGAPWIGKSRVDPRPQKHHIRHNQTECNDEQENWRPAMQRGVLDCSAKVEASYDGRHGNDKEVGPKPQTAKAIVHEVNDDTTIHYCFARKNGED